jgi:hypothetical protein
MLIEQRQDIGAGRVVWFNGQRGHGAVAKGIFKGVILKIHTSDIGDTHWEFRHVQMHSKI